MKTPEQRIAELETIIANALAALDAGLRGDVRRILATGKAGPVTANTAVIAGNFAR